LFVQDTPSRLEDVRRLIAKIDIAVRQVMIEARIVEASDDFFRNLGVRFGFSQLGAARGPGGSRVTVGAELGNTTVAAREGGNQIVNGTPAVNGQGLQVNLPASGLLGFNPAQLSFVLFNESLSNVLSLELSALESDGKGKIISSPRVLTADQVEALIEQGTELPYQTASSSGA